MSMFRKASKSNVRLRIALEGMPGAGKTWSAMEIMTELTPPGRRFCVIDTERGSSEKYCHHFDFDVVTLDHYDPSLLIRVINEAQKEGYYGVVIDSWSHFWEGKGGVLEMADNITAKSKSGNSFASWRSVTPVHNAMVDTILKSNLHVIATMRVKTEWVVEPGSNGRMSPRKVGLKPIQREGVEYEFDIVGDLDENHNLTICKTRCPDIDGKRFHKPGYEFARILKGWMEKGPAQSPPARVPSLGGQPPVAAAPAPVAAPPVAAPPVAVSLDAPVTRVLRYPDPEFDRVSPGDVAKIREAYVRLGKTEEDILASADKRGADRIEDISDNQARELLHQLDHLIGQEEVFGPGPEGPQIVEQSAPEAAAPAA